MLMSVPLAAGLLSPNSQSHGTVPADVEYNQSPSLADMPQDSGSRIAPASASPTAASDSSAPTTLSARSAAECFELLVREFDSIPDREVPAATGDGSPTSPDGSSTMMNDRYAPAQGTNVLIAKTIRAAIADMKLS